VGPRAVLEAVVKRKIPSLRRESKPRTPIVQPIAQRGGAAKLIPLPKYPITPNLYDARIKYNNFLKKWAIVQ
jgi:hypothetical protein